MASSVSSPSSGELLFRLPESHKPADPVALLFVRLLCVILCSRLDGQFAFLSIRASHKSRETRKTRPLASADGSRASGYGSRERGRPLSQRTCASTIGKPWMRSADRSRGAAGQRRNIFGREPLPRLTRSRGAPRSSVRNRRVGCMETGCVE